MSPLDWDKARDAERVRHRPEPKVKVGRAGDLPATPKQLALLRRLGVAHPPGLNRNQASALIDQAKQRAQRRG